MLGAPGLHPCGGERVGDVQLAGAVGALLGIHAVEGVEKHAAQRNGFGIPVGGRGLGDEGLAAPPLTQPEGAVADEAGRVAGPAVATGIGRAGGGDGVERDREPHRVAEEGKEVDGGVFEGDAQGVRPGRGHADGGEVGEAGFMVGLGVQDRVEQLGVGCGEGGRQGAAHGLHKVGGEERLAIGPTGLGAEVKGVNEAIGRDIPRRRDTGHGREVGGVFRDQALEEGGQHVDIPERGGELRIEIGEVGADAAVERLRAVTLLDQGLPRSAGGDE